VRTPFCWISIALAVRLLSLSRSVSGTDEADFLTGQDVVTRGAKFGVYKRYADDRLSWHLGW
jgi:hypothetical protein